MHDQATNDLSESQSIWKEAARSFVREKVMGENPQRFLKKKYVKHIKSEEIAGWMDFAEDRETGIDRLDELRGRSPRVDVNIFNSIDKEEAITIGVARKLVQRDRILKGYVDQYSFFSKLKIKPSEVQQYFDSLSEENEVNGCYILVSRETLADH